MTQKTEKQFPGNFSETFLFDFLHVKTRLEMNRATSNLKYHIDQTKVGGFPGNLFEMKSLDLSRNLVNEFFMKFVRMDYFPWNCN